MKALTRITNTRRNLALATCAAVGLGSFWAGAAGTKIVNENFDPPKMFQLFGFDGDPADTTREYVNEGVGGSTAIRLSATLPENAWGQAATILRQSGTVEGNNLATRENSVLSFDIKVDRPDLDQVRIMIESQAGYWWSGEHTVSVGHIPLGQNKPGVFKNIVVPLDDPLWVQNDWPDPDNMLPLFEPSGKTYQIWLVVNTDILPGGGHFTATIDNVQVLSKTAMVPWEGTGTGEMTWLIPAPYYVPGKMVDTGVATQVGAFKDEATWVNYLQNPVADVVLTAANGDKLFGHLRVTSLFDCGMEFYGGTGRFNGAVGGCNGTASWKDEALTLYSMKFEGCISTVGANKK